MRFDSFLKLHKKSTPNGLKTNIRPEAEKPLEERRKNTLDIGLDNDFLDLTSKA